MKRYWGILEYAGEPIAGGVVARHRNGRPISTHLIEADTRPEYWDEVERVKTIAVARGRRVESILSYDNVRPSAPRPMG